MAITSRSLSTSESSNERLNKIFKDTQELLLHPDYLVVNKDNQPIRANSSLVDMRAKLTPLISACEEDLTSEKKIISIPKAKALLQGVMKITQATYSDAVQINFRKKLAEIISGLSNENNDSKENSNAEKISKWIGSHQPKVLPIPWRTAATVFSKNKDQKSLEELILALEKIDRNKSNLNQSPVQLPQLGELLASGLRQSQQNEKNAQMQALEIFLRDIALERFAQENDKHKLKETVAAEVNKEKARMSMLPGAVVVSDDKRIVRQSILPGHVAQPNQGTLESDLLTNLKLTRKDETSATLRAQVILALVDFCKKRCDDISLAAESGDQNAQDQVFIDKVMCGRLALDCITDAGWIHVKINEFIEAQNISSVLKGKLTGIQATLFKQDINVTSGNASKEKEMDPSVLFSIDKSLMSASMLETQKKALHALGLLEGRLYGVGATKAEYKKEYLPGEFLTGAYTDDSPTGIAATMEIRYNKAHSNYTDNKKTVVASQSRQSFLPNGSSLAPNGAASGYSAPKATL